MLSPTSAIATQRPIHRLAQWIPDSDVTADEVRRSPAQTPQQNSPQTFQQPAPSSVNWPDFGSPRLNQQLRHYWRYVQTLGTPDVLIVGSSRALQGLDPHILSHQLNRQGRGKLRVYNFGINGATAQVVNWLLGDLLGRDSLPPLILWAKGSRAFNNARPDRTFQSIATSPGYQKLQQGWRPPWSSFQNPDPSRASFFPGSDLTFNGFLRDQRQFNPARYYQDVPKIAGQYDGSYVPFVLQSGPQQRAIATLSQTLANHPDAPSLVLINLPLSRDFLDPARRRYEQQFRQFIGSVQNQTQWMVRDYLDLWTTRDNYFADPSHINLWGAADLSRRLAKDSNIPWPTP